MIAETVELTSNPCPLVGDPKLSPTVPIAPSTEKSSSRGTSRFRPGLEISHWLRKIGLIPVLETFEYRPVRAYP
jgi:hypothetical protein